MVILLFLLGPKPQPKRPRPKTQVLVSAVLIFQNWQEPVDRPGRPTCTDVHVFVHWGPADRSGRPLQRVCSLEIPVDRTGRPTENCFSAPGARSTRAVDRGSNGQKSDRWRSTGPVDRQLWQNPTASFLAAYKLGFLSLFEAKILGELWASFSHSFKRVFSTNLSANISYLKGRFYQER